MPSRNSQAEKQNPGSVCWLGWGLIDITTCSARPLWESLGFLQEANLTAVRITSCHRIASMSCDADRAPNAHDKRNVPKVRL